MDAAFDQTNTPKGQAGRNNLGMVGRLCKCVMKKATARYRAVARIVQLFDVTLLRDRIDPEGPHDHAIFDGFQH